MKLSNIILLLSAAVIIQLSAEEKDVNLTPHPTPGKVKADINIPTAGYGNSTVQTQLRVNVKDSDKAIRFIRTNTDPYVLTKLYTLKHAGPYGMRGYLLSVVKGRQVEANPVQVEAIQFNDGRKVLMVSAEDYRFRNNGKGDSIDELIRHLDQPGIDYASGRPKFIYFPKSNTAANLREMVKNVGALGEDEEFSGGTDCLLVDGGLNALFIAAPFWSWNQIRRQLAQYDRPMPEIRLSYRLLEISTEDDDKIGVDFQSWKNNNGADFFSAGGRYRNNWATTFAAGINGSHSSRTDFFNFNPKWNSKYLDFLSSTGRAKVVTEGVITAKNRRAAQIKVETGLFYEEQDQLPDTRLNDKIIEGKKKLPDEASLTLKHGSSQTTKASNGFRFELNFTPVATGKAAILPIKVSGVSLLGWKSSGEPRLNHSAFETEIQVGYEGREFVVGGIRRTNVIRSVSGLPLLKDLPVLGWLFSTETETTRHSELVLIARAELSDVFDSVPDPVGKEIRKVSDDVSRSREQPLRNLGFEQFGIDSNKIE